MRSASILRCFPNVGFETVPLATWTLVTAMAAYRKARECEGGGWEGVGAWVLIEDGGWEGVGGWGVVGGTYGVGEGQLG